MCSAWFGPRFLLDFPRRLPKSDVLIDEYLVSIGILGDEAGWARRAFIRLVL